MQKNKLTIIGNGIVANLVALYLIQKLPSLEITIVGKSDNSRAIVGESTVELSTHFFEGLGLGSLLEDKHYHKYGLTYYFKSSDKCSDRKYVVHEAPGVIRLPAYNLNRFTFDKDLRNIISQKKITVIEGMVQDVYMKEDNNPEYGINIKMTTGETILLTSNWLIDASGTNRFLTKKLELHKDTPYQRSSFWFRLIKFDKSILQKIDALRINHLCYNPYYVTHHFYGKAYWVWMIPMRGENGETMMSIGYTYRPELGSERVKNIDDFLSIIEKDHPVIAELVRSGEIYKKNNIDDIVTYRNYMYESKQYYSDKGWFIIGDAAFLFDPINSLGLSYVSHMICQVASMIEKDMKGELSSSYVALHEKHIKAILTLQDTWSNWYEFMHDPVKLSWTLLINNMAYFHVLLPTFINGGFLDGKHINALSKMFNRDAKQLPAYPYSYLLDILSKQTERIDLNSLPNFYSDNIPFKLYRADEKLRKKLLIRYFYRSMVLRFKIMRRIKWKLNKEHSYAFLLSIKETSSDLLKMVIISLFSHDLVRYNPDNHPNASPFGKNGNFLKFSKRNMEQK